MDLEGVGDAFVVESHVMWLQSLYFVSLSGSLPDSASCSPHFPLIPPYSLAFMGGVTIHTNIFVMNINNSVCEQWNYQAFVEFLRLLE